MNVSEHHHELNDLHETDLPEKQEPAEETKKEPSEDRIVMLSDGIFAIAVTLLILDIKLPDTYANTIQSHDAFRAALTGDFLAHIRSYIVTFAILASYWLNHRHLMSVVKRIDVNFLWLNLLFLAFVAFFPIATSISSYGYFPEAIITYTLILVGCGYSALLLWIYAVGNHRLIAADVPTERYKLGIITNAIVPTFFLASLLLLLIPHIAPVDVFYSWLLLPIIYIIRKRQNISALSK